MIHIRVLSLSAPLKMFNSLWPPVTPYRAVLIVHGRTKYRKFPTRGTHDAEDEVRRNARLKIGSEVNGLELYQAFFLTRKIIRSSMRNSKFTVDIYPALRSKVGANASSIPNESSHSYTSAPLLLIGIERNLSRINDATGALHLDSKVRIN